MRRGGRNVTFVLGNQRRPDWPRGGARKACARDRRVRTGVDHAPRPSRRSSPRRRRLFVSEPVTAPRPSGKITSRFPPLTRRSARASPAAWSGRAGGRRRVSTKRLDPPALRHRRDRPPICGASSSSDRMIGASSSETWLTATTLRAPAVGRFSRPTTSSRKKTRHRVAQRESEEIGGQAAEEIDRRGDIGERRARPEPRIR